MPHGIYVPVTPSEAHDILNGSLIMGPQLGSVTATLTSDSAEMPVIDGGVDVGFDFAK